MRRGGVGAEAIRYDGYRRCPCGRLFPRLVYRGRPHRYCLWHRDPAAQSRLRRKIGGAPRFSNAGA